ncbi:hypothetical protein EV174_006596, partial [Coemansia sp. RSA 2320]
GAKERTRERKLKRIRRRDAVAGANEAKLMEQIEDPRIREALAKDPLLAKRMLNHRDKSLRDMVEITSTKMQHRTASSDSKSVSLDQIIAEASLHRNNDSSSSDDEDSWEALARKEEIRKRLAAKGKQQQKRKKFQFNPGFSDEEEQE